MRPPTGHRFGVSTVFLAAARAYWLTVFPCIQQELRYWRRRAQAIPDPELRRLASEAHRTKWSNVEGAAAFATFAPAAHRAATTRMLVRFQAAYDYADTVAEQPADDPIANSHRLHRPLIDALNLSCKQLNYYEHSRLHDDGGYLAALTDSCRIAFQEMPSRTVVQCSATHAASKIITYQSLNHDTVSKTHDKLARWARRETPSGVDLRWWETSAAYASSLTVLALLSAAASPTLSARHVSAIESAYHPWIGALHTLLDSLVDWCEDERSGQPNLLDSYKTPSELETRLQMLARRSRQAASSLPNSARHEIVLAAMVGVYVIAPGARSRRTQSVADRILEEVDDLASPVLLALRARRTLRTHKIGR